MKIILETLDKTASFGKILSTNGLWVSVVECDTKQFPEWSTKLPNLRYYARVKGERIIDRQDDGCVGWGASVDAAVRNLRERMAGERVFIADEDFDDKNRDYAKGHYIGIPWFVAFEEDAAYDRHRYDAHRDIFRHEQEERCS